MTLSLPFLFKPAVAKISGVSDFPTGSPTVSAPPPTRRTGVAIIGAGLAGLAAATRLSSSNIPFLLLEASDAVGGRVRTDAVDGFLLDRGFQIFITAYPEAKKLLDYEALDLQKFYAGALVYSGGRLHTVADPLRHFSDAVLSLANPVGSVADKLLIAATRARVVTSSDEDLLSSPDEVSTIEMLRRTGFSDAMIDRFFRPFFGGVFFDRELGTTSRLFGFIFKCLALGDNALPAAGISAVPEQLASKLPPGSIMLNSRVVSVDSPEAGGAEESSFPAATVRLENGEVLSCEAGVIVAVEGPEAGRLLPEKLVRNRKPGRGTVCIYFSADPGRVPVRDPVLILNGSGRGIVNNMFFATNVAKSYGPPGRALVSVSLIGAYEGRSDDDLTADVVRELAGWFGSDVVGSWRYLRTYRIRFAQPDQSPPTNLKKNPRLGAGLYVCGDHRTNATFDGALVSGREAAEALIRDRAAARV